MSIAHSITVPLLALTLAACDANGMEGHVVEGIDFDRLFAPPTPAEIAAVEAEWAGRDVSVQGYQEVLRRTEPLAGVSTSVRIVSHTVGGVRHYGAVLVPEGAAPASLPVLVFLHGGDGGVSVDGQVMLALSLMPAAARQFVVVVPSFRAEPLRYAGQTYHSEGPPSPWDRDVDDALALLNVALQTAPEADAARIAALGFSRGAAVGMLMAARDPRIDAVVEFFGPADFLGTFVQTVTEEALLGRPRNLPGLTYLDATFIQPLKQGETDLAQARLELVRRSAAHFAHRLPRLQVHHGTADAVVPVSEAHALDAAMRGLGRQSPEYEFYVYAGGGHDPFTLAGSIDRVLPFLARTLAPPGAYQHALRGLRPSPRLTTGSRR